MPQEQNSASSWPQNIHHDSLSPGIGDEDFTKFLDLDSGFEQFQELDGNHGQSSLETPMGRLAFGSTMQELAGHSQEVMQNMDMPQFQPYQTYQQMNQSIQYQIPPTPVSTEMHAVKYMGQIDNSGQIIFDRHQNSFTPLVSPAQTPLENAFGMPDYVMADEFFSPLTSPAIEAQPHFASTNTTASPIDLNVDHLANSTTGSVVRRRNRKVNLPQQRSVRSTKQSPAMKPEQKRRQFSLNSMSHEKLATMLEHNSQDDRLQPDTNRGHLFASSEDSVSPEPLSEALMRPPPLPSSTGRSPSTLQPKSSETNMPATPAMIMRMPGKQSSSAEKHGAHLPTQPIMEDITLPDPAAALPRKELPQIDTSAVDTDNQSTPTLSAKTPKLSADSTPRTSAMKTQSNSNESVDKMKKPEARPGGRGGKKRQNGSTAISPALRPKISPSISPLVPATGHGIAGISAETSALYLASKSNYQNILDGTHLPGVSYPETLAENLSSKRTSHKIAEQGRRNRINLALKEIESLLPASIAASAKKEKASPLAKDAEEGSSDKASSASQGASKASTVEMAIVYIKSLQAELKQTQEKLEAAEKTIAKGSQSDVSSVE